MAITVGEWGCIDEDDVTEKEYRDLEEYGKYHSDVLECRCRNNHRYLQANRFVGSVKCGEVVLDILPKTGFSDTDSPQVHLLRILCELWNEEFPSEKTYSELRKDKCGILEWFISVFIKDVHELLKKGLASQYYTVEGNEPVLRGRMLFPQDIKENSVLRDRFYVEYEVFGQDIPENRIIKETVRFLLHRTTLESNRRALRRILDSVDHVDGISDLTTEFSRCLKDRNKMHYTKVMRWCRLFLRKESLMFEGGTEGSESYLFNMDRIFEEYAAMKMRENLPEGWTMYAQNISGEDRFCDRYFYTAENPGPRLRPDMMFRKENPDGTFRTVIFDTKWKDSEGGEKISEQDHYQMCAYSYRYCTEATVLLYPDPLNEDFTSIDGKVHVFGRQFDLTNTDKSIDLLNFEFLH